MSSNPQLSERIIPPNTEEIPVEPDKMNEKSPPAKIESTVTPNSFQAAAGGDSRVTVGKSGSLSAGGDHTIYAPQSQAIYYKGYENAPGEWDEYPPPYANVEGLDTSSPGLYNDNPLVYHTGYGYSPQMPYGPYSTVTSVGGDSHLYSPQQYPFSGAPYYQQPYITSSTPVSQPEMNSLVGVDQQVDGMFYGPRPAYPSPRGSFGRGNISGNHGGLGYQDSRQGFESLRSGSLWSDYPKSSDRRRSLTSLSPSASPQTIGTLGSFGQNVGMASQQPRSFYGFGSGSNSYNRGYFNSGFGQSSNFGTGMGSNSRGWLGIDNDRRRVRGSGSLCSCSGTLDILSEQNRGPRASKPKTHNDNENSPTNSTKHRLIPNESYNHSDFVTEYTDAKFFIIKSYSEDNVHKSIKYGVWASTPNGNRKFDAAYQEAKEKKSNCRIFLLFSVNASAQFCGVAEMVGPVDFDKNVDYWQQDQWSGQFLVNWHIIEDVPNSQFRHSG